MAKIDKNDVLLRFNQHVGTFLQNVRISQWRAQVRNDFMFMASGQWDTLKASQREDDGKPTEVFNLTAPIIRAIAGHEMLNRTKISYAPRDDVDGADKEADLMEDVAQYIQEVSGFQTEHGAAKEDALICGLGGVATTWDYSDPSIPWGKPVKERIFPGFLLYDVTVRGRRINQKARWAAYVSPVSTSALIEYMEDNKADISNTSYSLQQWGGNNIFMGFFSDNDFREVDLLYHYEWYEMEWVYDTKNPFLEQTLHDYIQQDDTAANIVGKLQKKMGLDLNQGLFSLNKDTKDELSTAIQVLYGLMGVPEEEVPSLDYTKRRGRFYYAAEIARGQVIKVSRSWTQSGFSINYITGYYDEIRNVFYGALRSLAPVQRALNQAVSDYLSYVKECPKGGAYAELSAIPDPETFKATRANEKSITFVSDGALSSGAIQEKTIPQSPSGLSEFINMMMDILPRTMGLTTAFLGQVDSGDMTNALYGRMIRQAYAVLQHFFDSNREFMRREGYLNIDSGKMLAENYDGLPIARIAPKDNEAAHFRIFTDSLAKEYDIIPIEQPMTEEERTETFNMYLEASAKLGQAGVNASPLLTMAFQKYSPFDVEDKEEMKAMFNPPPPQPDPLQQALLQSQVALQNAQAQKLSADAQKILFDLQHKPIEFEADIDVKRSNAAANYAKAGSLAYPQLAPLTNITA